jgi:hypothetical protein
VFDASCTFSECHRSDSKRANLDLSSVTASCASLKTASCEFPTEMRTNPANPDSSVILQKLTCPHGSCDGTLRTPASSCIVDTNDRMPKNSSPLPQCTIDAIRKWIAMGLPGC